MFRLGLRLTLSSGREALVRLILTTVAVAIGVTVLLSVLADYHGYQAASNRESWESTQGVQPGALGSTKNAELWNYSENLYKGQFIEQLNVAALGPNAPIVPGLSKLPGSGQYYASAALEKLIVSVPRDELGNRFPGKQIGTIGQSGLSFPTELAIIIGYEPQQLMSMPGTVEVNQIASSPQLQGTTNIYRIAFGIGAIAILFPLLILINTASRLAASRREERYAALRLVGAARRQLNLIASVDATISALIGSVLGIVVYLVIHPALVNISFSGVKFFPSSVTPTILGYLLVLIGVPLAATISSLISLFRVQISPLGVSRKTTPPPPRAWRLAILVVGIPLFIAAAYNVSDHINTGSPSLIFLGFFLVMTGLVMSGSWLTMQLSRFLGKFAGRASTLLASRRLSDSPKVAFRSVSGLVLAVFVGSVIAVIIPAVNAAQSPSSSQSLTNILRMSYSFPAQTSGAPMQSSGKIQIKGGGPSAGSQQPQVIGLSPQEGAKLIKNLEDIPGTSVIPIYDNATYENVMTCASLKLLPILGACSSNSKYVGAANVNSLLFTDNPLFVNKALPIVTAASQSTSDNLTGLYLQGLLIKTNNSDTLEKVRTYLTNYDLSLQLGGGGNLSGWQMGDLEPETFGEIAKIRNNDDTNAEHVILAAVGITILVAGCSLAVTVGGSLVERRRPFTLLRVAGSPVNVLYGVVLLEAVVPLLVASVAAAAVGVSVSIPVMNALLKNLAPAAKYAAHPGPTYYIMIGAGLFVSLLLIVLTLPLLKRITRPEEARFE